MVVGTSQDIRNKILVVNSTTESPSSLVSKLIGKDDLTFKPIYSDEIQAADWQIDNKYYTADVEFWILNQHNYPPTQLPLSVEQLGNLCEALILVFDAAKHESFEKLNNWSQFVEECNPNILLCVGIGKSDSPSKSEFNAWSSDNGLEFVEIVDGADGTPAEASVDDENDDPFGGAEGKDRIVEALASTMWANMKQKARSRLEDQFSRFNLEDEEDDEESLESEIAQGSVAPTFDPFNFDEDLRLARGEFRQASDEISQNLRALQSFLRETEAPAAADVEGTEAKAENEAEAVSEHDTSTEANVEQFESALTGLRRLRENAQQLPDAQRKALAAHVISMLFPDQEDWQ